MHVRGGENLTYDYGRVSKMYDKALPNNKIY